MIGTPLRKGPSSIKHRQKTKKSGGQTVGSNHQPPSLTGRNGRGGFSPIWLSKRVSTEAVRSSNTGFVPFLHLFLHTTLHVPHSARCDASRVNESTPRVISGNPRGRRLHVGRDGWQAAIGPHATPRPRPRHENRRRICDRSCERRPPSWRPSPCSRNPQRGSQVLDEEEP